MFKGNLLEKAMRLMELSGKEAGLSPAERAELATLREEALRPMTDEEFNLLGRKG